MPGREADQVQELVHPGCDPPPWASPSSLGVIPTFSATLRWGKRPIAWKMNPIPRRRITGSTLRTSTPSTTTWALVGPPAGD